MSDIFLDTLTYYKAEIDQIHSTESTRVDTALDAKVETSELGVPGGVATLDGSGDIPAVQVPFATEAEAADKLVSDKIISPKLAHILINSLTVLSDSVGQPDGVPPLDTNGKVPLSFITTPTNDGEYKLQVTNGVATWVTV